MKQRQWTGVGERGQRGAPGGDIDRRAGQHQLAHFGGKARGIKQRQPAALAQPDEIDAAAEPVDRDVELGEVVVDAQVAHLRRGRAPVGDEQPPQAGLAQRRDQAVAGREIGHRSAMQREGRANQCGHAAGGRAEIAQPHGLQFKRDGVRRRPSRLARRRSIGSVRGKADEMLGQQCGKFARRGRGECRPHETKSRILPSLWLVHAKYLSQTSNGRVVIGQPRPTHFALRIKRFDNLMRGAPRAYCCST